MPPAMSCPSCRRSSGGRSKPRCCSVSRRSTPTTAPWPPPSSKPCDCSPATVRSASRSTTSSGWMRRRLRRSATRSPAWIVSRSPPCWRSAATCRTGFAAPCPRTGCETVEVGGLSLGATHELLHARLDATFPRPTLIRLWETSRGNPFFALELASALQRQRRHARARRGAPDSLRPRRAPARAHRRPRRRRRSRSRASSPRWPTRPSRSWKPRVGAQFDAGLAEALDARILELDGDAAAIHASAARLCSRSHARRPRAAGRFTRGSPTSSPSAEERARHLALATAEPSREIASILEEAARTAHARGAPAAAAELAEQALRLTPASDPGRRPPAPAPRAPTCTAAQGTPPSHALLEQARADAAPGQRARNDRWHIWPRVQASPQDASRSTAKRSSEAEGDDALQATIHLGLAALMRFGRRSERGVLEHAELRRPRRLARRRRRAPLPRTRRLRPHALQRRTRHSARERWTRRSRSSGRWPGGRSTTDRRGSRRSSCSGRRDLDRARDSLPGGPRAPERAERSRRRGGRALVPELRSSGGRGTGRRRTVTRPTRSTSGRSSAALIAARTSFPPRSSPRTGPDRRRARQVAGSGRTRRSRGHRASRSRATAGCSASSSSRSATPARRSRTSRRVIRASQRVHARAGAAPGARRPARSADRRRRARRGRGGAHDVAGARRARSTGPGRSRSLRAAAGCCSPRGAISRAPSRASSARSPSTLAARIRSSTRGRCSPSAGRSGARRSAATPARPSRTRWHASSGSARRSGPSRRAPSWRASAGVRPRTAS